MEKLPRELIWKLKGKRLDQALGAAFNAQILRPYSTDMSAVMDVAKKIIKLPDVAGADELFRLSYVDGWWTCVFGVELSDNGGGWEEQERYIGTGGTAAQAICRAALMALSDNRSELTPSVLAGPPAAQREKGN